MIKTEMEASATTVATATTQASTPTMAATLEAITVSS